MKDKAPSHLLLVKQTAALFEVQLPKGNLSAEEGIACNPPFFFRLKRYHVQEKKNSFGRKRISVAIMKIKAIELRISRRFAQY